MTTNHILEIVNDLRLINQSAVALYLSVYLLFGSAHTSRPQRIILPDLRRMALCLMIAIAIWAYGAVVIGVTVKLFRAEGIGGGPGIAAFNSVPGMAFGSVTIALGALLVLRIMSIARYGNIIWWALVGADLVYLAFSL